MCSNDWNSPSRIGQRTCTMLTNSIKSALAAIALQSIDCKLERQLETQRKCSTCNNLKRRGIRAACSRSPKPPKLKKLEARWSCSYRGRLFVAVLLLWFAPASFQHPFLCPSMNKKVFNVQVLQVCELRYVPGQSLCTTTLYQSSYGLWESHHACSKSNTKC